MATRYTTFGIPQERGKQLRDLARAKGMTVGDLVVHWIVEALEERGSAGDYKPFSGEIRPDQQGWVLAARFFGRDETLLRFDQAEGLLNALNLAIRDGGVQTFVGAGQSDMPEKFKAARRGAGLALTIDGFEQTMSMTVAQEVAQVLDACCAELRFKLNDPTGKAEALNAQSAVPNRTKNHPNYGKFA